MNEKSPTVVSPEKKLKYPKAVFFIVSNEFCERFSFYGMRTILALYLTYRGFNENQATLIYHVFVMICYFTPVAGGIIADSYLGRYKTILYISLLYAVGNVVLSIGSVTALNINHIAASMVGLFLIGVGTGGVKPCVSAFGGDQFVLPQQETQLQRFFSVFYFAINLGSMLSTFASPILRENVHCFGENHCYPLAFGVPSVLMCIAVVIFVCGKPVYKINKPKKANVAVDIVKCSGHALLRKIRIQKMEKKNHWLDYADDKFNINLIEDTKIVLKIIYLFLPTIVFWALFEQQGSRWTFQANHMDGDIGFYIVQPDQMQIVNSILCLLFIPFFQSVVYPLLGKIGLLKTPLQKLSAGGLAAALAFLVSGALQTKIEAEYPVLPISGMGKLRFYNTLNCSLTMDSQQLGISDFRMNPFDSSSFDHIIPNGESFNVQLNATFGGECASFQSVYNVTVKNKMISNYMFRREKEISLRKLDESNGEDIAYSKQSNSKIKVLYGGQDRLDIKLKSDLETKALTYGEFQSAIVEVKCYLNYDLIINGTNTGKSFYLSKGGVYTLLIENATTPEAKLLTITEPYSVNILWQLPQYFILTAAEILFSITGLEFFFTQSPLTMKSLMSSLWLLTTALGNVIILIVAGIRIFESQASEFFLFAGLMTIVMGIFIMNARNYQYVNISSEEKETDQNEESRI